MNETKRQQLWHKIKYFARNGAEYICPRVFFRMQRQHLLNSLTDEDKATVATRALYCCKLSVTRPLANGETIGSFRFPYNKKHRLSGYFFDLYHVLRFFPSHLRFNRVFGDVTDIPVEPSFVKSRPIAGDNANSVLLKLNSIRHFFIPKDTAPYEDKMDKIVFRNACSQPQRLLFLEKHFNNPMVDARSIRDIQGHPEWRGCFMSIQEQMKFKFVACIEGNDVATNLKWVMASNSIAVMPKPKYETWFMEGTLIPDYHFICVKEDYSDLEERLNYFLQNPEKAHLIIRHAHDYVQQFFNSRIELATSLKVAELYFKYTDQKI